MIYNVYTIHDGDITLAPLKAFSNLVLFFMISCLNFLTYTWL